MNNNCNDSYDRIKKKIEEERERCKYCYIQEPRGAKGERGERCSATIKVGKVETIESTLPAEVINTGTSEDVILDFKIPKGDKGEEGEKGPQGEYLNTYMILNENPYYIVKLLERQKNNFTEEEYYKILSILPFSKVYKTVNTILYLLKNNKLCETSLMKHLFAVDFYNCKENKEAITNLKYAHLLYGPVVDSRNSLYNFLIKNDYIKIEINDISTNFTTDKDFDKKLFTKEELNSMKLIKDKFKGYSVSELSDWSHSFKGYIDTKNGEIIDYKYAEYLDIDSI